MNFKLDIAYVALLTCMHKVSLWLKALDIELNLTLLGELLGIEKHVKEDSYKSLVVIFHKGCNISIIE